VKIAPHPINRCPLDRYVWERGLTLVECGEAWGCSYEHARRICLPFSHPDRRTPSADTIGKIMEWSEGALTAADHYPSHLNGVAAEPGSLAPAGGQ